VHFRIHVLAARCADLSKDKQAALVAVELEPGISSDAKAKLLCVRILVQRKLSSFIYHKFAHPPHLFSNWEKTLAISTYTVSASIPSALACQVVQMTDWSVTRFAVGTPYARLFRFYGFHFRFTHIFWTTGPIQSAKR